MPSGRVIFVSPTGAMLVVKHDDGYALVEMIGDEGAIAIGDTVRADWDALGGEPIWCNGSTYDAYFQGSWGSPEPPLRMARGGWGALCRIK
jgi:hypothetical protein